ncbi:MAG: pyridoxamine 5'-phosphate oxidase family protein [Anaerolineae bacterium]|nr:pyridoxamine 5'-phosphate oxidase family protein [Anaerolineae bacterium]
MNVTRFEDAVAMAQARQHVWISTADALGVPHIASVGDFRVEDGGTIVLSDWACPVTLMNLKSNTSITLVVWDVNTDQGYQILGQVEDIKPLARISEDGLAEATVGDRELWVKPHQVYAFSHAPHDDVEAIPPGMTYTRLDHSIGSSL